MKIEREGDENGLKPLDRCVLLFCYLINYRVLFAPILISTISFLLRLINCRAFLIDSVFPLILGDLAFLSEMKCN